MTEECRFLRDEGEIGLSSDIIRLLAWIKHLENGEPESEPEKLGPPPSRC
jgi:hypothetical protein